MSTPSDRVLLPEAEVAQIIREGLAFLAETMGVTAFAEHVPMQEAVTLFIGMWCAAESGRSSFTMEDEELGERVRSVTRCFLQDVKDFSEGKSEAFLEQSLKELGVEHPRPETKETVLQSTEVAVMNIHHFAHAVSQEMDITGYGNVLVKNAVKLWCAAEGLTAGIPLSKMQDRLHEIADAIEAQARLLGETQGSGTN